MHFNQNRRINWAELAQVLKTCHKVDTVILDSGVSYFIAEITQGVIGACRIAGCQTMP